MTPSIVVDCSVAMAWCFADETTSHTRELASAAAHSGIWVPAHWWLEVANVLEIAQRKRRLTRENTIACIELIATLSVETDDAPTLTAFSTILPLASEFGLTSYDAVYLELAARRKLPLATLDTDLRKAAKKLGIAVLGK